MLRRSKRKSIEDEVEEEEPTIKEEEPYLKEEIPMGDSEDFSDYEKVRMLYLYP